MWQVQIQKRSLAHAIRVFDMLERWRRPGGKKYVTRRSRVTYFLQPGRESIKNTYCMGKRPFLFFIANLHAIFNDILRKKTGLSIYCGLRQWASLSMGRVLKFSQTDGIDSVWCVSILSDFLSLLRLNAHEFLAFVYIFVECTLPRQSSIANRVLHKRQRKLLM